MAGYGSREMLMTFKTFAGMWFYVDNAAPTGVSNQKIRIHLALSFHRDTATFRMVFRHEQNFRPTGMALSDIFKVAG